MTASIKRIAVIGTGVIGSGWIIRFLANKKTVYVFDPNKEQKKFVLNEITRTQRSVKKFYKINSINRKNLIFAKSIEEAVKDADLIQENVTENETIKKIGRE